MNECQHEIVSIFKFFGYSRYSLAACGPLEIPPRGGIAYPAQGLRGLFPGNALAINLQSTYKPSLIKAKKKGPELIRARFAIQLLFNDSFSLIAIKYI